MRDPYLVLGVPRTASETEIKKAFRRLAKENHPDRNADNPKAMERFKEANSAYELLSDSEKKAQFDRGEIGPDGQPTYAGFGGGFRGARPGPDPFGGGGSTRSSGGGFEFGGAEDLFSELFGNRSPFGNGSPGGGFRTQPRGPDVAYRLTVPFTDAATLKPQRVTLKGGKTVELKLPAGIESGRQLRMPGQGEPGPAGPGDAIVTIEVAGHRVLRRDGDDIRLDLPVRLDEAVLGAKVRMPTAEGPVTLTIPPGTNSGKVFRLKGRGFSRSDGGRGDQLVTVLVDLPADDAKLKAFAAEWADARDVRRDLGV